MIHHTLNDANEYAAEMSSFIHGTYTVVAHADGTYETVNGPGRGRLVSLFVNGRKTVWVSQHDEQTPKTIESTCNRCQAPMPAPGPSEDPLCKFCSRERDDTFVVSFAELYTAEEVDAAKRRLQRPSA
jgi:hypothetical protein